MIWGKSVFNIFYKTYKIAGAVHKYINTIKINWHYSKNKNPKLSRREKILRQHTASADKKEYVEGTISWY